MGGVAGGQKYVVHEILFKFAYDQFGLFKGLFFLFFFLSFFVFPLFSFKLFYFILFYFIFSLIHSFSLGDNLAAAKVGGHELKGLMSYFSLGLSVLFFSLPPFFSLSLLTFFFFFRFL